MDNNDELLLHNFLAQNEINEQELKLINEYMDDLALTTTKERIYTNEKINN